MKLLEKTGEYVGKYMAWLVLFIAALSLLVPETALWIQVSWINWLLMAVMFGMGLAIKPEDFIVVFRRPKEILIGCIAQFTIMPATAYVLCRLFHLDPALSAGVVLVGTCPGGTASNVITYFSGGDVPLSVGMTSVNTLLAPLLTPLITYVLLRTTVSVDVLSMFRSIVQVVLLPIGLGFLIHKLFSDLTEKLVKILPLFSTAAICLIVGSVVSHNAAKILSAGGLIFAVVIMHNLLGYACGFALGKALGLSPAKIKAMSIEIGMQNSGLAASLAASAFANLPMAAVPGALFSVWHNISGAVLAQIYRKWNPLHDKQSQ